jgi:predicted short-subunit dehydrogenase-like oxidoreductase (DUF2520 family)
VTSTLRIGLLAASRIAAAAVVEPDVDGVEVTAVAARDLARAQGCRSSMGGPARLRLV